MKKNELQTKKTVFLSELQKEIEDDYKTKIKEKAKQKIKEIKMLEITLEKSKKDLDKMLNGEMKFTEEDLLFKD